MAIARASAAAALLVAASLPAGAADETEEIRRDVAALVAAAQGIREDHDGPSPTRLARRLLERKEKAVQAVLKEAWAAATAKGSPAAESAVELERVIRFLHGFDGPADPAPKTGKDRIGFGGTLGAVYESDGVVLARPGGTGERGKVMGEPGWDRDDGPGTPRKFEALVKGGKWRKPGKPDARKLLQRLDDGSLARLADEEKRCFALALGEACGVDAGILPKLLQRFGDDPTDEVLGLAVAGAGAPAAVTDLRSRVGPLAVRVAEGKEAALPLLRRICRGLSRTAPEALAEEIGKLSGGAREAAFLGTGFRAAAPVLAAEYEAAADVAGKEAAFFSMVRLILRASFSREFPAPADMPRVVRIFREMAEGGSDEARRWAEEGAYGLFYMGWRDGEAHLNFSSNEVSVEATGRRLGPYPDMRTVLGRLDEDLRAGRIAFGEEGPALFGPTAVEAPGGERGHDRAWSGVPCPIPTWAEATASSPLRLQSERTDAGLRLTLRNEGAAPVALDPVALRYACAEYLPVRVKGAPGGPKEFTYLKLEFGPLGGWKRWRVPAKEIRVLAKGESCSWDVAVAPEHREAGHVSIEIHDEFTVEGACPAPLLRRLGWSWVR